MKHYQAYLLTTLVLVGGQATAQAQTVVDLGAAGDFAVLAGSGITFAGAATVSGHIGSYSTATITGVGNVTFLVGENHAGDAITQAAKADLTAAYDDAFGRSGTPIASELGGTIRTPGVYSAGTFAITGNLTLSGSGVYIFQAASTLNAAANSQVLLTNGATADNVFWQVGSSATLVTDADFAGNILAYTSITVGVGADVDGRMLAQFGAVTFGGTNTIAAPAAIPEPATSVVMVGALMGLLVGVRRWRLRVASAQPNNRIQTKCP